ncbi:MAG TPA: DinB family protein [Candidatus Limnocylindria bacterium]|nr:DinB family protein [Candidatus Limnocylindria bacterium]
MTTPPMLRQLRHDIWATEKLIAFMRAQPEATLDLTTPGTYGTIRRTLAHIVAADERYLLRLGVARPDPAFSEERDTSLDEIARHLASVKDAVEALFAGKEFEPDRWVADTRRPTREMESWTMVTQFAHHGSDHRAHVGTILGRHGLETPQVDVWAYGSEIGAIRERR